MTVKTTLCLLALLAAPTMAHLLCPTFNGQFQSPAAEELIATASNWQL
jgi:hypothetical protein